MVTELIDTGRQTRHLCSDEDRRSFLVPCYGFEDPQTAREYRNSRSFREDNRIYGDDFAPIFARGLSYVPRIGADSGHWLTTEVVPPSNEFRPRSSKPVWDKLRGKETSKPRGSYNVALLVQGPREFYRDHRRTTKHPKWWHMIADGTKECFTAWGRKNTPDAGSSLITNDSTRVYAARSGRGVIYARETEFDNLGNPSGFRVELVRVEFTILDRDPAKDDMMRVELFQQTSWSSEPHISEDLDAVWHVLIDRARTGFERWCQPVPAEVEKWRQLFVDQHQKRLADSNDYSGDSFANRVSKMDWQDALRAVEEPWQLAIVASYHGRRPEFSSDGGAYTIPYETVPTMIERHDCTEERRDELRQMIRDYVEPADSMWNYRGDWPQLAQKMTSVILRGFFFCRKILDFFISPGHNQANRWRGVMHTMVTNQATLADNFQAPLPEWVSRIDFEISEIISNVGVLRMMIEGKRSIMIRNLVQAFKTYWPIVSDFHNHVAGTARVYIHGLDEEQRDGLRDLLDVIANTFHGISGDEEIHRQHWLRGANSLEVNLYRSRTSNVHIQHIAAQLSSRDPITRITALAAVEVNATAWSLQLLGSPRFKQTFSQPTRLWWREHLPHSGEESHLSLLVRMLQAPGWLDERQFRRGVLLQAISFAEALSMDLSRSDQTI